MARYLRAEYTDIMKLDMRYENLEIIKISLNRFTENYGINSYSITLFDFLDVYCKENNVNCNDFLKLKKSEYDTRDC